MARKTDPQRFLHFDEQARNFIAILGAKLGLISRLLNLSCTTSAPASPPSAAPPQQAAPKPPPLPLEEPSPAQPPPAPPATTTSPQRQHKRPLWQEDARPSGLSKEEVRAKMFGVEPGKQIRLCVGKDVVCLLDDRRAAPTAAPPAQKPRMSSVNSNRALRPAADAAQRVRDDILARAPVYKSPERITMD